MNNNNVGYIFFGVIFFVGFIIFAPLYYFSKKETVCTFRSKERIVEKDNSRYLIYCNEGIFQDTDSWVFFKFDSSDIYNVFFKVGKKYKIKTAGWRNDFLSMYPNVISVQEDK